MLRRNFIAGAAAAAAAAPLARPALAQGARARTLVFVPQANLSSLDPVWTTATVTRNFAFLVYETLYGLDATLKPSPQMAAGHQVADDGRRWTVTLRDGLAFHDGSRVTARDCAASLSRWMKRDAIGQTLAQRLDALETPDERTLVFRLNKPFASLPFALAKITPSPPVIMPERLALTDPFKQVTEVVGSGPFRFVPDEYVSGSRAVFARNENYKPREEAPSFTAGARRALVDRVEWRVIPDASTANNALVAGEVDWLEIPLPDLLPQLRRAKGVVVDRLDTFGLYPVLRPNQLQGPTTNKALRQAMLAAINPVEVMQAFMGDDASAYHAPVGAFLPGTESASDAAMDRVGGTRPLAELRAMVKASGYNGEPIPLMHPTDQPIYDAMSQVAASQLKRIGLNIEDIAMDWGTVVQRRSSKEPLDKGGWSLFCTSFPAVDYLDPLSAPALRGNGGSAWYGWPNDPKLESLHGAWLDAQDAGERKRIAADIQTEAFESAVLIPLGQYFQSAAWRSDLTGLLKGPMPVFWNVQKS